ncbi:MAG: hypothetical protein KC425_20140 [Anaerolineales bacterium]|nr:hypothetical protein [Anaerolineales bacterium]
MKMTPEICEHCGVGRYVPTRLPYLDHSGGQLIIFPNAPAFACDVCKHMYYDAHFLYRMDYLLDQLSRPPAQTHELYPSAKQSDQSAWSLT